MNYLPKLTAIVICCLVPCPINAADEVFDSKGVKIRYVTDGKGEAIVLIHGWMGDSSTWGRDRSGNTKLNTADADGFQLIALDCRGHGKSDKPHEVEKYGPEMAEDVVRLLDHLKIEKAHLIGYSMGAYLVGKVAATHPERVISIVYGGQAPLIARPPAKIEAKPSGPGEVEIFAKAVEDGKGLGSYVMAVRPAGKPKPTEEQANAYAKILYDGKDVKAFAAAGLSFKNLRVTEEDLKKCKAPVLFIHGANEAEDTKKRVAALSKVIDRCEVKVIEGADHITTLAKPEFATALKEFLRANKSK